MLLSHGDLATTVDPFDALLEEQHRPGPEKRTTTFVIGECRALPEAVREMRIREFPENPVEAEWDAPGRSHHYTLVAEEMGLIGAGRLTAEDAQGNGPIHDHTKGVLRGRVPSGPGVMHLGRTCIAPKRKGLYTLLSARRIRDAFERHQASAVLGITPHEWVAAMYHARFGFTVLPQTVGCEVNGGKERQVYVMFLEHHGVTEAMLCQFEQEAISDAAQRGFTLSQVH